MSTVICHQAFHDSSSHVVEATTMRLKLVPPNCTFFDSLLSQKPFEIKPSYTHPDSRMKLTPKSLELCTESLGSETGCDTTQNNMLLYPKLVKKNLVSKMESKKVVSRGFPPPPLTTISSLNLVHVRRHHEGGRLIIEAMAAPPMKCCFRAERSHGRLRLTYWKSQDDDDQKVSELENDKTCVTKTDSVIVEEDERIDDEVENEKQKIQWPSRCKEDGQGGKGMRRNWEPFLLATS